MQQGGGEDEAGRDEAHYQCRGVPSLPSDIHLCPTITALPPHLSSPHTLTSVTPPSTPPPPYTHTHPQTSSTTSTHTTISGLDNGSTYRITIQV